MKKPLLFLSLCAGISPVLGQSPWVVANQNNIQSPPSYLVVQISALAPGTAWGITRENAASTTSTTFMRTNNAAGTEFDFNTISARSSPANSQAANISAVSATTALVAEYVATGGGDIVRTTDGGNSWSRVTTNAQFATPAGFNNWVHMFNATEGVSLGDPNPLPAGGAAGQFEVLRTTDGGLTWSRVPGSNVPAPLDGNEYGLVRSYFALGNTIWAGTSHHVGTTDLPVRVLKSTDKGLTWTVANTPLIGSISRLAFSDANNGIAFRASTTNGVELIRTTDGGTTWSTVAINNTPTGSFYRNDIDAVPGGCFISVGPRLINGNTRADFGSSFSRDGGLTWTNIDRADQGGDLYTAVDVLGSTTGFAGGVSNSSTGAGAWFKFTPTTVAPALCGPSSTRRSEASAALTVYPNPSQGGTFKVQLAAGPEAGAELLVYDRLGRPVLHQTLRTPANGTPALNLDLSKQPAGLYLLEVRTPAGINQVKLVVE